MKSNSQKKKPGLASFLPTIPDRDSAREHQSTKEDKISPVTIRRDAPVRCAVTKTTRRGTQISPHSGTLAWLWLDTLHVCISQLVIKRRGAVVMSGRTHALCGHAGSDPRISLLLHFARASHMSAPQQKPAPRVPVMNSASHSSERAPAHGTLGTSGSDAPIHAIELPPPPSLLRFAT